MVAHAFSLSTQEVEVVDFLVQGQPGLPRAFQDSEGCYTDRETLSQEKISQELVFPAGFCPFVHPISFPYPLSICH